MTDHDDLPRTKEGLLQRMTAARAAIETVLGTMTEAQLTEAGADGWSVKDHLAHLTAWERSLIALLRGESRVAAVGLDEETYQRRDEDQINAIFHERAKDRPLSQILDEFRRSRATVMDLVSGMTQADLERPYSHYQPNDPPYNATPVAAWIIGNTFAHDEDHLGWINALLEQIGRGAE
jgi:hypothetical protein